MKKLLVTLAILASTSAFADKIIVEKARVTETNGTAGADAWYVKGTIDINKNLAVDASLQTTQVDVSNKISSRYDFGVSPKFDVYGSVRGYTRVSIGEKISTTGDYRFYAVEPGINATLANNLTGQLGYRFRNAFDSSIADTTRTLRAGVTYDVTNKDAIGVRLDSVRGDSNQNIWNVNYIRSF